LPGNVSAGNASPGNACAGSPIASTGMNQPAGRLAVLGATGGTGRLVVEAALRRGHPVTALARRPAELAIRHPALRTVAGDVLAADSCARVLPGADGVISALGIGMHRHATTVYSEGTGNLVRAMTAAGVRRLVLVSTASIEPPPVRRPAEWAVGRLVLHPLLRKPYADMAAMERLVRQSATDWTIVRAARLTDAAAQGRFRVAVDAKLPGCWSISRADLSEYLLDLLDDRGSFGRTIEIAY
jgi:putative NADH-flavin reductase